jgi:hypothetical protein
MTSASLSEMRPWARARCEEVVETCRVMAIDGTTLFTPDGIGHYGALWTRDFAYLVEHGGEFLRQDEVRAAIEVLLAGQRADGAIPDRVNRYLVPIYHPGAVSHPMGAGPALDNAMFMVALIYHYHRQFHDPEFVRAVVPALRRALSFVPLNRGLVFNDSQLPSCTYGFQDTVAKGGHDLFCSLLYVAACRQMAELDSARTDEWHERAVATEDGLWLLWDEASGLYLAADELCRQVDVWGNAFAVAHKIGDAARRARVAQALADRYATFVHAGQVRHLPEPESWERLFQPVDAGTYQNGGYWGTASGWLIEALKTVDPGLAERTLQELIGHYRREGVLEWIAPDGRKGPDLYVATILNVWSLVANAP